MAFGGFRFAGLELKNILGGAGMKPLLVALAREDEVFGTVPTEPHDLPVQGWATERGWVVR